VVLRDSLEICLQGDPSGWFQPNLFGQSKHMTIVAEQYAHVVGVDTHAKTHTFSVLAASTGAVVGPTRFPPPEQA
jgi:hypothetical protein